MGYSTPTDSKLASIHRMLNQGPPNSGKTASFRTWPGPKHIQVSPGEKGDATIPRGEAGYTAHLWQEDSIEKLSSLTVVQAVENMAWNILAGKYGPITSFCFDGFHKYYGYVLDMTSGGQLFRGEPLGDQLKDGTGIDSFSSARIYNRARERARYFVQRVNASPVENILWTCWDGREADDPTKGFKGASHIFPNLPGAAAKEFMGEFGLVVHSRILWGKRQLVAPALVPKGMLATNVQRFEAKWQLLPEGDVWGACVKAPIEVIERLPSYCDQDYNTLKKILEDAWQSVASAPVTPTAPAPAGKPA